MLGALVLASPGPAAAAAGTAGSAPTHPGMSRASGAPSARPSLAILDPVDLSGEKALPEAGEALRKAARKAGRFQTLPGPETAAKLREFAWNSGRPCHEFQCAFEAGNVLMADYVLFGTLTPLEGISAYTFHLLAYRTGRVVEAVVGHVAGGAREPGGDPALARLADVAAALDPARLDSRPRPGRGLIAVLDGNPGSVASRALAERAGAHIHEAGAHDLMGQAELRELVDAMGIPLATLAGSDSGLLVLGARLNLACLVQSKLEQEPRGQRLELALFDIAGKRRVRSWTSQPTRDFQEILRFESRFFATLRDWPEGGGDGFPQGGVAAKGRTRWGRTVLGLAGMTAAGGLGTLAYASRRKANAAYRKAESSPGPAADTWKRRTETEDRTTVIYGTLAALTLGASLTVWSF